MDALTIFNSIEAVLWISIGVAVLRRTRGDQRHRRLGFTAAIWFFLFGISDIFEVSTGAWWRPWPLLVFKATCVVALVSCGIAYRRCQVVKHP